MAILVSRDLYILKALRHKPLSLENLHARLLTISKKKFGNEFISQVDVDTPASPIVAATIERDYLFTKPALKSRLTRLLKDGFIKSRTYAHRDGRGRSALYAVGKLGIPELYRYGIERSDIHCTLPNQLTVAHKTLKTLASAIAKVVKQESSRLHYKVQIADEKYLRKTYKKRGTTIPDLLVSMTFNVDRGKVLKRAVCLKVDNDNIPVSTIYNTCTKLEQSTIFLCTMHSRLYQLKTFFATMSEDPNYEKIVNKIFFALTGDFMAHGLAGSTIMTVDGRHLQVIPYEFPVRYPG